MSTSSGISGAESRKVAVVTGGAGGLGRACAQTLATSGFHVAIIDNSPPDNVANAAKADLWIVADVTIPAEVESAIAQVESALGQPAAVVNAAGILRPTRILDISFDEWNTVVSASLTGTFLVSQACARVMVP